MKVRLYSIPGSHPVAMVEAMLRYKGIEYKRLDLVTVLAKFILRRFPSAACAEDRRQEGAGLARDRRRAGSGQPVAI